MLFSCRSEASPPPININGRMRASHQAAPIIDYRCNGLDTSILILLPSWLEEVKEERPPVAADGPCQDTFQKSRPTILNSRQREKRCKLEIQIGKRHGERGNGEKESITRYNVYFSLYFSAFRCVQNARR